MAGGGDQYDRQVVNAQISQLKAELAERDGQLAEQATQLAALTEQVRKLTELLNQNSKNSHLPPASDGPGASGRAGSKRKLCS